MAKEVNMNVNVDAWSSGQIDSKLWLCRELEKIPRTKPQTIWILGGWYGLLAFLLFSRERMPIRAIRSFELDGSASDAADKINENWVWRQWQFKSFVKDANTLVYEKGEFGDKPDIVINTSTEHFSEKNWFHAIPPGTLVALQSNNMEHSTHTSLVHSLQEFRAEFPLEVESYGGVLKFEYPTHSFERYFLLGRK